MIREYKEAFQRCYPDKSVEVRPKKVKGEIRFRVVVDKDPGDLLLTKDDIMYATKQFNRGKVH